MYSFRKYLLCTYMYSALGARDTAGTKQTNISAFIKLQFYVERQILWGIKHGRGTGSVVGFTSDRLVREGPEMWACAIKTSRGDVF